MKRLDMTSAMVLLMALAVFTGCGDDSSGDGGGGAGMGGDGDGVPMEVIEPTYANIQERVFAGSCAFGSCHDNAGPPAQGLDLVTDPIAALVGMPSTAATGKMLVVAGDPDSSYIIEKISSMTPAVGVQMPPNQPLAQNKIDALRAWIANGAKAE